MHALQTEIPLVACAWQSKLMFKCALRFIILTLQCWWPCILKMQVSIIGILWKIWNKWHHITWLYVFPVDRNVVVSIRGALLVIEPQCVKQFVFDCAQSEASYSRFIWFKVQLLALWWFQLCYSESLPLFVWANEELCTVRSLFLAYWHWNNESETLTCNKACQMTLCFIKD